MPEPTTVLAAGALVWRGSGARLEVLTVHRPKHDDWTLPKGKVDPGERLPVTAVREVLEETGVPVRLGLPLGEVEYDLDGQRPARKRVSYWVARPVGDGDTDREPDDEVDQVRWVPVGRATRVLTHQHDRTLLDSFHAVVEHRGHRSKPLVILRHAQAQSRDSWAGPDAERPLTTAGRGQAHRLVPLLAAFGVRSALSSDALRCRQTLEPYALHLGREVATTTSLSESGASPGEVARSLREVARSDRRTAVSTHRPVLPLVEAALGLPQQPLSPAGLLVVHRRGTRVLAVERHQA